MSWVAPAPNSPAVPVHVDRKADLLIDRYQIRDRINEITRIIAARSGGEPPVTSIHIDPDAGWNPELVRVLVTVTFEGDAASVYHAWRRIRPAFTPISEDAEDREILAFQYDVPTPPS